MSDFLETAGLALSQWSLEPARVTQISHSENIVFRVETTDRQRFVLRMHRPGYHSLSELESEQIWTSALLERGLDVPVAVRTAEGLSYGQAEVDGQHRYVGLLEWVEGQTMSDLMQASADPGRQAKHFFALGELLAHLHEQASTWQPPAGFIRHSLDAEGLMGLSPFWGPFWQANALTPAQRAAFDRLRRKIYAVLAELPKEPECYSLIHADLHPGNVVVSGERLHVIDFDDAGFGWHAYDFAVALKNYQHDPGFSDYQQALLEGYGQHRSVADDILALIPLFLVTRALASIGWADARPELGHPEYVPELAKFVEAHADEVLEPFA